MEVEKIKCIQLNNASNIYSVVPLLEVIEAPAFILGNIRALKSDATENNDAPNKDVAEELYQRFKKEFEEIKPNKFRQFLYRATDKLWNSVLMQNERERVAKFQGLCRDLFLPIKTQQSSEIRKIIAEEIGIKRKLVRKFFGNNTQGDGISENTKKVLFLYREKLNEIRQKDPALYDEFYETIISIIINEK